MEYTYKNRIINFQQKYPLRGIENFAVYLMLYKRKLAQFAVCIAIFNCIRLKQNLKMRIKTISQ